MENGPFIVDCPTKLVIFHRELLVYQRVATLEDQSMFIRIYIPMIFGIPRSRDDHKPQKQSLSLHKKIANVGPNANLFLLGLWLLVCDRSPVIITNFWGDWNHQWIRLRANFTGKAHIYWENLWFRVDFPLSMVKSQWNSKLTWFYFLFPGFRCRSRVRALQCPLHRAASNQKAPGTWNCRREIRMNLRHAIGIHRIFLASWFLHAQVVYFGDVMWQIQCHSHHPISQTWLGVILNHSISRAIPSGNLT